MWQKEKVNTFHRFYGKLVGQGENRLVKNETTRWLHRLEFLQVLLCD